jgi:hypothetical protein
VIICLVLLVNGFYVVPHLFALFTLLGFVPFPLPLLIYMPLSFAEMREVF